MAGLSFIVTYRDRKSQLEGFIRSIKGFYPKAEIVVSEQGYKGEFLQGQLFNLAYPYSGGGVVILMDADIRFQHKVDFSEVADWVQHPFIGYDRILNCTENGRILGERKGIVGCYGGCCVFTRKQFEDSYGYSNLIMGWGGDDTILNNRVGGFKRIVNTVLHVDHGRRKHPHLYERNAVLCRTEHERKKELDGFRQTIGNLMNRTDQDGVVHLVFDRIGVVPNFAYRDLLK